MSSRSAPLLLLLGSAAVTVVVVDGAAPQTLTQCAPGSFLVSATQCSVCSVNAFGSNVSSVTTGIMVTPQCFESFEENNIGTTSYSYGPPTGTVPAIWANWVMTATGGTTQGGISGSTGAWAPSPACAYVGSYFAFIQATALNIVYPGFNKTVNNLVPGSPASLSFAYADRNAHVPLTGSMSVTYGGQPVGTVQFASLTQAWQWVQFSFTPATSSGVLVFTIIELSAGIGYSINFDAVSINQLCPAGMYSELATGTCVTCSSNTLSSTGCFESFEAPQGGVSNPSLTGTSTLWMFAPTWNSWTFSSTTGLAVLGSQFDTLPSASASGTYYAFLQVAAGSSLSSSISKPVSGLAGSAAVLQFYYSWRSGFLTSPANATLSVSFGGFVVFVATNLLNVWTPVSASFPISSTTGTLTFSLAANLALQEHDLLLDAITLNSYCAPGSFASPSTTSCAPCPAGTFLSASMYLSTSCAACASGYFASSTGATACTICPSGFFCASASAAPVACAASTYSQAGATACTYTSSSCPAGSYAGTTAGVCSLCPAGTASSSTVATSASTCVACTGSLYSPAGASACASTCPTGTYLVPGTATCMPCNVASFSHAYITATGQGMTTAATCVESFEGSSIVASTGWSYMPGGNTITSLGTLTFSPVPWNSWTWSAGGIAAEGASIFDTSPASIAPSGGSYYAFVTANPGTILHNPSTLSRTLSNLVGGVVGVSFAYGSQSTSVPAPGSSLTVSLGGIVIWNATSFPSTWTQVGPVFTTLSFEFGMSNSQALLQFALYQASNSAATVLLDVVTVNSFCYCSAGSYAASGAPSLSTCALSSACAACTAGASCPAGTAVLVPGSCSPGTYCAAGAGPVPCPPGTFSSVAGASSSASCVACGLGSYSLGGATSCTACPAATSTLATGASSLATCQPCAANFFAGVAQPGCNACPSGSVSLAGSTSCTCTSNWVSNGLQADNLKCTCPYGAAFGSSTCTAPVGAPFTQGNLVLLRVGDGSTALSASSASGFIDEYTTSGSLVQSFATTLTASGTDRTVGSLTRTNDGAYIMFSGLAVGAGTAPGSAPPFFSTLAPRAVARVSGLSVVDTSTSIPTAKYDGILRAACSLDGSGYWLTGNTSTASGSSGVAYVPHGAASGPTSLYSATTDFVGCGFMGGSLYLLRAAGTAAAPVVYETIVASPTTSGTLALSTAVSLVPAGVVNTVAYYPKAVAISKSGQNIYIADLQEIAVDFPNAGIWQSTNAGASFTAWLGGNTASGVPFVVTGLALNPAETLLFFTTTSALYQVSTTGTPGLAGITALASLGTTPKEFRGLALVPCVAGTSGFSCVPCAVGTTTSAVGQSSCAACPAGQTTLAAGATTCVCAANFYSSAGACIPCPSGSISAANSAACTCQNVWAVWVPSAGNCFASATPTATATASATATSSATGTSTASGSASGTMSSTASSTATSTLSATPSQTPSSTSTADVLLLFSFSIAPLPGVFLKVTDVTNHGAILTSIKIAFTSLLGLSAGMSLTVTNVSDVATGSTQSNIQQRRLGTGAAGSQGVSIFVAADLGKAPDLTATSTMLSSLATLTPGTALSSSFFAPIVQTVAAWNGQQSTAYTAAFSIASVSLVNSPFSSSIYANLGQSTSASSSTSSSSTVSVGVGVAAGVVVLACSIWSWRSWQKHGKLPCFRDRVKERREAMASQFARNNQGSGGGGDFDGTSNPVGGDLIVRALAKQVADQKAEVARLHALAAAEKAVANAAKGGASLAGPREQLRAQEAAKQAVQRAEFPSVPTRGLSA